VPIFLWYEMDCIENDVSKNSSIVVGVFVATITFLLSQCLAMIRGYTYSYID
jgi:hypothetical protein